MKTTIDIADDLLLRGKKVAKRQNVTLRALIEEGLHQVLSRREKSEAFHWKPVTVKGKGINPALAESGWAGVRGEIYKGRGA
jgi:hypothetical protein